MSQNEQLVVRDAADNERDAIRKLTFAAYEQYATSMPAPQWTALRDALPQALDAEGAVQRIVAEQNGTIVGSVLLFPPSSGAYGPSVEQADWPELRLLAVAPSARGQGIGRALVEECVRRARAAGATSLGLHTSDGLGVATRLYEQMGFVRDPQRDFVPEDAEVVKAYRLDLSPTT